MELKVNLVPAPGASGTAEPAAAASPVESGRFPMQREQQSEILRLVIEQDPDTGSFVYKSIDPVTREVVSQLPREEILRLRHSPSYAPGQLAKRDI